MKFGTQTNSNLQNLMVMFTFLVLELILLLRKFGPKIQDGLFEVKFGINSIMMLTLLILHRK